MAQTELTLTDPHELLEVYTADGRPTGRGVSRGEIHRQGLWHRAFFCWIARPGPEGPEILLQHRALRKDVFPGWFDASAAGHQRLGEDTARAARELQEELGLPETLAELMPFGTHREQHFHPNGLIDREHHALHLLVRRFDDAEFRPDPAEVQGLAWVPSETLLDLVEGRQEASSVSYLAVDSDGLVTPWQRELRAAEIVPYQDGYFRRMVELAARTLSHLSSPPQAGGTEGGSADRRARHP